MQQDPRDSGWQVVCLCAAWCGVCREWDAVFRALAPDHPQVAFAWVDVEDDDDAMADMDIETFPTLLVAHGDRVRFFGPVVPSAPQVRQLLARLRQEPAAGRGDAAAAALLERLRSRLALRRV
jgi:thioredoxin 1